MSVRIDVAYEGDWQCTAIHGPSKIRLATDAPIEYPGAKARSFSPTDLLAAALGTCMTTLVAMAAEKRGLSVKGLRTEVDKEMSTEPPRRITRLAVRMVLPASLEAQTRQALEAIARACPVGRSLHPETKVELQFHYE
jgi:putative redox protein